MAIWFKACSENKVKSVDSHKYFIFRPNLIWFTILESYKYNLNGFYVKKITVSQKTREIAQKQLVFKKLPEWISAIFQSLNKKKLYSFGMKQMLKGKNMEKSLLGMSLEENVTYKIKIQWQPCWLIMTKMAMWRETVKNIKESEPEIFRNLFLNLKEKIAHANKYGLETLTNWLLSKSPLY